LKSPAKATEKSPGRLICVGTGKSGGELCALADLVQLKKDGKGDRERGSPKGISEQGKSIHGNGPELRYFITRAW
jgi:hypothetical protein